MPLLPLNHARAQAEIAANMGPFGETIANVARPAELRAGQS
jgi:alkanesulfonate monooxygenase